MMPVSKKSLKLHILLNLIKAFTSILFPMLTFKYASNVLSAENLGIVSFCSSIIGYFTLFAGLGISSYATREGAGLRNDKKRITIFSNQVFTINCISCFASIIVLLIFVNYFESLRAYRNILLVQSLVMIFTTLGTEWINIIFEDFLFITIRTVAMQVISLALLFVLVKGREDSLIYVGITVFAQVGIYLLNIFHIRKYVKLKLTVHTAWRIHLKPILIIFASTIAVTIYATIDTTMIGIFCEKADIAFYSAATKIYIALKSVFATVLAVMIPRLSYLIVQSERYYNDLLDKVTRGIFLLLIPCTILSNVLCKDLILLISGKEYLPAYLSLHVLSVAVIFSAFSTCIVNNIFLIRKKEKITLIATTVGAAVDFALNLVLIRRLGYFGASVTTLIAEVIVFGICYLSMKRMGMHLVISNSISTCLIKDSIAGILMLITCMLFYNVVSQYFLRIIIVSLLGGLVFILTLVFLKHELLYGELIKNVKKIIRK